MLLVRSAIKRESTYFGRIVMRVLVLVYLPVCALLAIVHYPRDTDTSYQSAATSSGFYEAAYSTSTKNRGIDYEAFAKNAAQRFGVIDRIQEFVRRYDLTKKRILEVGSGSGYLQDVVEDYTGLDISTTVAGHYHKPFVSASATAMPFGANAFDAIWTVWVLEHIPEPERALVEMRRVLKPGAVLFLFPAWECTPWAAEGLDVRSYSEFNWHGKVAKAFVPLYPFYLSAARVPTRAVRWLQYANGVHSFHYRRLHPNYDIYWEADSDAAVSLDRYETYLWFRARGDECLNCESGFQEIRKVGEPLIVRIVKP